MALRGYRRSKQPKEPVELTEKQLEKLEKKEAEERRKKQTFDDFPHLLAVKPSEHYLFRSDYFEADDYAACVLGYFHDDAANETLPAFWGVGRIPYDMPDGVTTVVLEQVRREGQKWVDDKLKTSDKLDKLDEKEQADSGTASSKRKSAKIANDMEIIAAELQDGAAYLHIHMRLFVKAPSLEVLEEAIDRIRRSYIDRFGTLFTAPYHGEQRKEMSTLFMKNARKRGKGFHLTSEEFAGAHSIVTHGLDDPAGTYVGEMMGDVNNSAVIFDVNKFEERVVVADGGINVTLGRSFISDMWGSKISQQALVNNSRAVHLVLDGADLNKLGPKLEALTSRVDLSQGDVNMFEMFGEQEDELNVFPAHLQKLVLMAEQAYETTETDRSVIRGQLEEIATQFYVDYGMWHRNAKEHRDRLRVVGIPHDQVPLLRLFVTYLDQKYQEYANKTARDDEMLHAYSVLRTAFKNMLDNNGDLFNNHTKDAIDGARLSRRVIYDFAQLQRRGSGVAMAQLVNIVSFAVDTLATGDVVVVHGAENISEAVKPYINMQFERMMTRGGRVAYLYNDIDKMLADQEFNKLDKADYTILGPMRNTTVEEYQKSLRTSIPPNLESLVTRRGENMCYLRRGVDNVVFKLDLPLGVNPARASNRAAITERLLTERKQKQLAAEQKAQREQAQARRDEQAADEREEKKRASRQRRRRPEQRSSERSERRTSERKSLVGQR